MQAVHSGLTYVECDGLIPCPPCSCQAPAPPPCPCPCPVDTFHSVWDRLCRQLFGAMPPGIDPEDQLPDIDIWKDGIALVGDTYPYTFVVATDGEEAPKKDDVIEYKGRFYVIGEVVD